MVKEIRSSPKRSSQKYPSQRRAARRSRDNKRMTQSVVPLEEHSVPTLEFPHIERFRDIVEKLEKDSVLVKRIFRNWDGDQVRLVSNGIEYSILAQKSDKLFREQTRFFYEFQNMEYVPKVFAAWTYKEYGFTLIEALERYDHDIHPSYTNAVRAYNKDIQNKNWVVGVEVVYYVRNKKPVLTEFNWIYRKRTPGELDSYGVNPSGKYNFPTTWKFLVLLSENEISETSGNAKQKAKSRENLEKYKEEYEQHVKDLIFFGIFSKDDSSLKLLQQGYKDILPMIFNDVKWKDTLPFFFGSASWQ